MSEATVQAAIIEALSGVVREGSILVNDYRTPQVASRDFAPWLIIEAADDVSMSTGASYTTPSTEWAVYVGLLTYRGGQDDDAHMAAFQSLRQDVLRALALAAPLAYIRNAETTGASTPYFNRDGNPDPDSLFQRLAVTVVEYGV